MKELIDLIFAKPLDCYLEIRYNPGLSSIRFIQCKEELRERKTKKPSFELEQYLNGEIIDFSFEIDLSGLSAFSRRVLDETRKIKYGKKVTYSELAKNIGCSSARPVGGALGNNPVPIVIPCHRVVARNGIGGYSAGVEIKTKLLALEEKNLRSNNL